MSGSDPILFHRDEEQVQFHNKADAKRFFNRLYNPFICKKERMLTRRLLKHLNNDDNMLEIGCGEGSNLYHFHEIIPELRLIGIDFSAEKIAFMKEFMPEVEGIVADATMLPINGRRFDLILMRDLLHHVNWAREQILSEALHVAKNGAKIIIIESKPKTLLNRIFMYFNPEERGMKDSTPEKLRQMCDGLEYTMETCEKSYLLRAAAYLFGWPEGRSKWVLYPLYACLALVERILEVIIPGMESNVIITITVK